MKYNLRHTIKIPADVYFKVITSPSYDKWSAEKLNLQSRSEIECNETPDRLVRKTKMVTKQVSDATRMMIRASHIECIETFDVNKKASTFIWDFVPNVWTDKITARATGKISSAGTDSCLREMEFDFKISIPFILGGRITEKKIENKISEKIEGLFEKMNESLESFYHEIYLKK